MKIKGIIFDFNGTLFFDNKYHLEAWEKITREMGIEEKFLEVKNKMYGAKNKDFIHTLNPKLTDSENEALSKRKEAMYREICLSSNNKISLTKGAIETFEYLKSEGIPFMIASSSIKDNMDFFVEIFSLRNWFEEDKTLYDDGSYKTKKEMFEKSCEILKIKPEDSLAVEDSVIGIEEAKKAKIGTIIGIGSKENYEKLKTYGADECISDFVDFKNLLK